MKASMWTTPTLYSREWFSWANMMFCELVLDYLGYPLILFENLFKPRQLYLQPQSSALSSLRLAS